MNARNYWQILLHRTIKSNAMVVDTTCMQAGLADPHAGAYRLESIAPGRATVRA